MVFLTKGVQHISEAMQIVAKLMKQGLSMLCGLNVRKQMFELNQAIESIGMLSKHQYNKRQPYAIYIQRSVLG
jgi:hypothetical protein